MGARATGCCSRRGAGSIPTSTASSLAAIDPVIQAQFVQRSLERLDVLLVGRAAVDRERGGRPARAGPRVATTWDFALRSPTAPRSRAGPAASTRISARSSSRERRPCVRARGIARGIYPGHRLAGGAGRRGGGGARDPRPARAVAMVAARAAAPPAVPPARRAARPRRAHRAVLRRTAGAGRLAAGNAAR